MDEELLDLNTLGDEVAIAYLTDITDEDVLNIIPDASERTVYEVKTIVHGWAGIVAEVIEGRQKKAEEGDLIYVDHPFTVFNLDRGCK